MLGLNNDYGVYHQKTADLGGQRILGMGGSLTRYIETGNQYDTAEFKSKKASEDKKENKGFLKKALAIGGTVALALGGIFIAAKCKKVKVKDLLTNNFIVKGIKGLFKGKKGAPPPP